MRQRRSMTSELRICQNTKNLKDSMKIKMTIIKDYIKYANDVRHKMRKVDLVTKQEKRVIEEKQMEFLSSDLNRLMEELIADTKVSINDTANDQLLRREAEIPEMTKKINTISSKLQ